MRKFFLTLTLAALSSTAFAGGYRVALQGVRQAALGGTASTSVKDASVAFYNPAGLAFIESKLSITAGVFGVKTDVKWQDPLTLHKAETDNKLSTPMYLAVSYKPVDDLAIGVSVSTPFGSSLTWPKDWENKANITSIELKAFNIQPTVAYKFTEWFSVGFGFIFTHGTANLQKIVTVANNDMELELDNKKAYGTGFNIGAMFRPTDKLNIGLAYRSNVDASASKGNITWRNVPNGLSTNPTFLTTKWNTVLPLPSEFTMGASYLVTPKLQVFADVSWNNWSEYRKLDIELYNPETGYSQNSVSTKNWKDNTVYKFGLEYTFSEFLQARLGYYNDASPVPSAYWSSETPSTNINGYTAGLGFNFKNGFAVDLFGSYLHGSERHVNNIADNFTGDVRLKALNFGIGVTYNLK